MTASGASYGPASFPDAYVGTIVGLQGTRILLSLNGPASRLALQIDLQLDPATGNDAAQVCCQTRRCLGEASLEPLQPSLLVSRLVGLLVGGRVRLHSGGLRHRGHCALFARLRWRTYRATQRTKEAARFYRLIVHG
jgi:hypothetical protein